MYYVVLDLEWNQYHNPMWTPTSRSGVIMHEEIIQIGAVKTDKHMIPVDTFNLYVRLGGRRRLDRYVKKLTGIDENALASGEDFPVAAEMFAAWLSDVDGIFSWGADDRRVFLNNLSFHGLEAPSCAWYDAQKIYASQVPGHGGMALKNIAEESGLKVNLSLHDAMNDAVLTAMCMMRLDMEKGVKEYASGSKGSVSGGLAPVATARTHRHPDKQSAWDEACASLLHCPACMKSMEWTGEEQGSIDRFYKRARCAEHGEYVIRGEFQGVKNQTLKLSFFESSDDVNKMIEKELRPAAKKSRRRRRGKGAHTDPVAALTPDEMFTRAIGFAAEAHKDQLLEPGTSPYIVHPMEVTRIVSTMTDDSVLLCAAMLHDTLSMCPAVTADILREKFSDHVAELVESHSARNINLSGATPISEASDEEMMLLLADMLSALRAMYLGYQRAGAAFFNDMGAEGKKQLGAYCRSLQTALEPLKDTGAYEEFGKLTVKLFGAKRK